MVSTYKHGGLVWIDLESPTKDEVYSIGQKFDVNPVVLEELLRPSDRSKVELYDKYLYLILHFPAYRRKDNKDVSQEIDFIIGKKFIITTHYRTILPLHELTKSFEAQRTLERGISAEHSGFIFMAIVKKMYDYMGFELGRISNDLKEIEKIIFEGEDKKIIEDLSRANKELIDFKRTTRAHSEILASFRDISPELFGKKFTFYANSILGWHERIWHMFESNKEVLLDLRQTSDSLFTTRTNSIIRTLTILTFVSIPFSIIANMVGGNLRDVPIAGMENDFLIIISLMVATILLVIAYLKHKKWL